MAGEKHGGQRTSRRDITVVRVRYGTGPDRVAFRPGGADPPCGAWLSVDAGAVRSLAAWR